ncbi:MAG: type II toxin-antitoxin system VapC family toxin [Chloroflexota bacterium]|nr:MAG: type II toxin-antitoxin system VapC family toxin [Chloroflexota bacterium]
MASTPPGRMTRVEIEQVLPAGDRLLLDTTTLIAYLNGGELISPLATHIIDDLVRSGRNPAVVSPVTVMEVLVRPLRRGPDAVYQHVLDFLSNFPNLRSIAIDLHVAQEAASLRATYNLHPPDALIIASGIVAQVGHLVTNDAAWQTKLRPISGRIKVCCLGALLPRS